MRIEGQLRTGAVAARGAGARTADAGAVFQLESGSAPARALQTAAPVAASGIAALLALQAVEDPALKRRKAVKRGQSILDVLEEVRADLLVGQVSEGRLNLLMALIAGAREATVPGLDALLDDIELRARVELAKLGRFPPG